MRLLKPFRLPFFAAVVLAIAAAVAGSWLLTMPPAAVAAAVFVLGRDPARHVPSRPLGVVSPVDGYIESVERGWDPYLERDALIVRLCQGIVAPAVLHSPIEGRVEHIWGGPSLPDVSASTAVAIHVRTDEADDIVFSLSRARLPGPLQWSVQPGERVGQGQRRGLAGWGRSVSIYMPANSRSTVQSGHQVHAGADVVARLIHPE